MAQIHPLRALHYDPAVAGPVPDVTAPPYDVIDATQRAALLERSPFNVVAVDLPQPDPNSATDQYTAAGDLFDAWQTQGVVIRDQTPALWPHTQTYTGPDGQTRTRSGFFCRVRIEGYGPGKVRPHERTHPGPKEDRLKLMRATRANLSPIFSLFSDPTNAAWSALGPTTETEQPWGEVTDADGTIHRIWRAIDPDVIAAVENVLAGAELLIADGHHRYETAAAYADEIGGEGEHRYMLMCLVALQDPGLTVFPTHRLIRDLDQTRREALRDTLKHDFEMREVPLEELAPPPASGPLELGYIDSHHQTPYRLTLKDQAIADAALPDFSEAYRRLDTGVLEALILKGALGLSDDDISHFNGLFYARSDEEADRAGALGRVRRGVLDAAHACTAGPGHRRLRREHAAQVDVLLPKATDRLAL